MTKRSCLGGLLLSVTFLLTGLLRGHAAGLAEQKEVCRHEGDLNQRVAACEEVIGRSGDRRVLLRAHNTRGLALCDLNRCAEAIPDFDEVIHLNPLIAGYFDNRARALRAAQRFDEAIRDSDHALQMAPGYAFIYFGKALALEGENRFEVALGVLDQASAVDPTNAGVWELRGKLLGEAGRFTQAYAAYDRALELQPSRDNVFRTRAGTEELEGKLETALNDLRRYTPDGPEREDVSRQEDRLSKMIADRAEQAKIAEAEKVRVQQEVPAASPVAKPEIVTLARTGCLSIKSSLERLDCYDAENSNHAATPVMSPNTSVSSVESAPPTIVAYGAADLPAMHDTYEKNQARFFRDYENKTFSGEMPLASVSRNIINASRFDVTFGSQGEVSCGIEDKATIDMLTELNKGDLVKLSGTIGDHTFGTVQLKDCSVSKP